MTALLSRAALVLPLLLGACASMEAHRAHCAASMARVADRPMTPGGPVTDPAKTDPAVEACAVARADAERTNAATGVLAAVLLVAAAGLAGAAYSGRSSYRPAYRPAYRAPSYRRFR